LKTKNESNSREDLQREEMEAFVARVAAAVPLPGGGSVAALTGALAAALGEMMAGLTERREQFASVQPRVADIHAKLTDCRSVLQALVQEDSAAYQALLTAIRLPRETEEQRAVRAGAVEQALRGATETPLRTARAAYEILEYLKTLIEVGNPNARSDAAVGAQLAYASLKGAQYNILTNIRALKDASFANSCRWEISDLIGRGQEILDHIDKRVVVC
jgi:formiminotetrahydrofolate cyclodeaminase